MALRCQQQYRWIVQLVLQQWCHQPHQGPGGQCPHQQLQLAPVLLQQAFGPVWMANQLRPLGIEQASGNSDGVEFTRLQQRFEQL